MKYLVLYEGTWSMGTGLDKKHYPTLKMEPFDDEKAAVQFCKENNGQIVKALDLVLEKDGVDE